MIKSNQTIHHFDAIKWKRRLINFSNKLNRSHSANHHWNACGTSATAMAAATEKVIRHHTDPSEIVIHSEDLTASQFANMTGIKTKRNSIYSSSPPDFVEEDDMDSDDSDDDYSRDYYNSYYSISSSHNNNNKHHAPATIWDSHFWQDRKSAPTTTSVSMKAIASHANNTPCSQPLSRQTSEPGGTKVPSMVQKGRFKIVWGNDDSTTNSEPVRPPNCVEWKRKRAGSSSSTASTTLT